MSQPAEEVLDSTPPMDTVLEEEDEKRDALLYDDGTTPTWETIEQLEHNLLLVRNQANKISEKTSLLEGKTNKLEKRADRLASQLEQVQHDLKQMIKHGYIKEPYGKVFVNTSLDEAVPMFRWVTKKEAEEYSEIKKRKAENNPQPIAE
jgi:hypothetical protein